MNAFRARLQAMARAHDLLTQESWQRADLAALVSSQATVNGAIESERVNVSGPPLMLGGQVALNLALVIHELASNALRHGSLSVPEGQVDVSWQIDDTAIPRIVDLTWREFKGPLVRPPTELGFGAKLVERSLKRGLGANVDVAWEPGGIDCSHSVAGTRNRPRRLFRTLGSWPSRLEAEPDLAFCLSRIFSKSVSLP